MTNSRQVIPIDSFNLLLCLLVTIGQQATFFVVAYGCQFDKVTDFAGGTNFVLLQWILFFVNKQYTTRHIMVLILTTMWGLRLAGYLLLRILKIGTDKRFDDRRENFCAFLAFWVFQAVWVFTVSLPAMFIAGSDDRHLASYTWVDVVGWVLFLIGLICEAVADQQKFNFRNDPKNKGKFCNTGLWAISRHPNYFGEILLWWAMFICGIPIYHLTPSTWVSVVSPLFITLLLLFVSGIPMLEQSADKRYGALPEYVEYKRSVPVLVPFVPALFRGCGSGTKAAFCCEWGLYSASPDAAETAPIKSVSASASSYSNTKTGESVRPDSESP
eukprot:a676357_11.p1 GENE.a676357_11~~a676357_11.p1  ORF type:complete len:339 (+),score=100.78 a676357_11:31-1017(+)